MDTHEIDMLMDAAERWFVAHPAATTRTAGTTGTNGATATTGTTGATGATGATGTAPAIHAADAPWQDFASMGWLALSLAESDGGFGADLSTVLTLIRLAARHDCQAPLDVHLVLAPLVLRHARDLDERQTWAEALASGQMRLGMADGPIASPSRATQSVQSGGKLAAISMPVHGVAVYGGDRATHIVVVSEDDAKQRGCALLECAALDIPRRPARWLDGRPMATIDADLVAARPIETPADDLLAYAAAAQVADACGAFEAAFDITLTYLKQREQFGRPLAALQVVQHRMADVFCDLQQLLALVDRLGREDADWGGVDPITLAVAKSHVGRRALRGVGQLIQLSGGIGVTDDYWLGRLYKRVHVAAALFGSAEHALQSLDARTALLTA